MKKWMWVIGLLLLGAEVPAQEREVRLERPWGTLSGTLTMPRQEHVTGNDARSGSGCTTENAAHRIADNNAGNNPASGAKNDVAALLIAGSGPTDRNGNSRAAAMSVNIYYLLAQTLQSDGIASLRYDKRGIGNSPDTTPEEELRLEDYIADAAAWVVWLRGHGFARVVLIGHSEGALIALQVAADDPAVAGVVTLAGAGYPIDELVQLQLANQLVGYDPGLMLRANALLASLQAGERVAQVPPALEALFRPSVQPFLISSMQYDPRRIIRQVEAPVLIVSGDNDLQVVPANAEALSAARPSARKVIVPGMTHVLKTCDARDLQGQLRSVYTNGNLPLSPELGPLLRDFIGTLPAAATMP